MLIPLNNTPPPGLFFINHTTDQLRDLSFARLLIYPNVFVTGHPACLTRESRTNLADTTVASLDA